NHARVLYQPKHLLRPEEVSSVLQAAANGTAVLPPATSTLVKQALAYVHEHYHRQLTRHDIATAVSVSESYLSQIFHRELGVSPLDYLGRLRIHIAKHLNGEDLEQHQRDCRTGRLRGPGLLQPRLPQAGRRVPPDLSPPRLRSASRRAGRRG